MFRKKYKFSLLLNFILVYYWFLFLTVFKAFESFSAYYLLQDTQIIPGETMETPVWFRSEALGFL
jgi:hypothetical protein